jgi:hypothetical protein
MLPPLQYATNELGRIGSLYTSMISLATLFCAMYNDATIAFNISHERGPAKLHVNSGAVDFFGWTLGWTLMFTSTRTQWQVQQRPQRIDNAWEGTLVPLVTLVTCPKSETSGTQEL